MAKSVKGVNITKMAEQIGLKPTTVLQRIRRGAPLDIALLPLQRSAVNDPNAPARNAKIDNDVFGFFVDFTRQHGGIPPSLTDIQHKLKVSSVSIGRYSCLRLAEAKKLLARGHGKYIIAGSRWLDQPENDALNRLIERVKDLDDPEIKNLITTLTEHREIE